MMELKDTIEGMCASDYVERFRAEFNQVRIRADKLENIIKRSEDGTLEFTLACPIEVLKNQLNVMRNYMQVLKIRSLFEGIHSISGEVK